MHERTNIRLSAAERSELEAVVGNRNSPQKHVWRAKIVLLTADAHGTADIMRTAITSGLAPIADIRGARPEVGNGQSTVIKRASWLFILCLPA
jgi:hypothetical protein